MRAVLVVVVAAFMVLGTLTVAEQQAAAKEVSKADKRKAKWLFRKGGRAYRKRRYKKAVKYLLQAYTIWSRREMLFNIASAFGKLGDKIKAVTYLRDFIKDANPREMRTIPKWLREMQDEVAVIKVLGIKGSKVEMNGKVMGQIPLRLVIMPGMHLFVVTKPDGKRLAKRDWDVTPGLRRVWEVLEIKPRRPDPPPRVVKPVIIVRPRIAPTPIYRDKPRKGINMGFFITAAVAAAGAGIGAVITGLRANKLHDDYVANPTVDVRNDGLRMRNLTNALIGVSGALGATAIVLAIFTQWKKPKKEKAASRVNLSIGAGSFLVRGRF